MSTNPKRPPLTALLREQSKPLPTLEEQQRIQAENDRKLYGTRSGEPLPVLAAVNPAPRFSGVEEEAPAAPAPASPRWIPFGSYIYDQVYLQLKQAEFWEPGFEIRKFVNNALQTALQEMTNAQRPLPAEHLEALQKKTNKLKK